MARRFSFRWWRYWFLKWQPGRKRVKPKSERRRHSKAANKARRRNHKRNKNRRKRRK